MLLLKFKDLTAIFFSILDKSEPFQKKNPYEYRQIIVLRWYVLALKYCVINDFLYYKSVFFYFT